MGRVADSRRTDAVLLLVALVWGSSYLSAQTATSALPVLVVLFARYALSALACLGLVAAGRGTERKRGSGLRLRSLWRLRTLWTREEVRAGLPLGVTQAAVLVVETYGVAHTTAANAGLIISLTIVLTLSSIAPDTPVGCLRPSTPPPVSASWPSACSCPATASTRRVSVTC